MTNQDINEAVARKLGWEWTGHKEPNCWMPPQEWKFKQTGIFMVPMPLQNYCTSIAAAWEIPSKYPILPTKTTDGKEYSFCLMQWSSGWTAAWVDLSEAVSGKYGRELYSAWADTAPMAVCWAFLKLP